MVRKLSQDKIELIQTLYYNKGLGPKEIARRTEVSKTTVYFYTHGIERGFKSSGEWNEYIARNLGFKCLYEYQKYLAEKRAESYTDYLKNLAEKRGTPYNEYLAQLDKERQKRPESKKLSKIIKRNLNKLGKDQRWLARATGISESEISKCANGMRLPKKNLQQRISKALHLPNKTLEELLK